MSTCTQSAGVVVLSSPYNADKERCDREGTISFGLVRVCPFPQTLLLTSYQKEKVSSLVVSPNMLQFLGLWVGQAGLRECCQAKGLSDFKMEASASWKPLPFMCSVWPSML